MTNLRLERAEGDYDHNWRQGWTVQEGWDGEKRRLSTEELLKEPELLAKLLDTLWERIVSLEHWRNS